MVTKLGGGYAQDVHLYTGCPIKNEAMFATKYREKIDITSSFVLNYKYSTDTDIAI